MSTGMRTIPTFALPCCGSLLTQFNQLWSLCMAMLVTLPYLAYKFGLCVDMSNEIKHPEIMLGIKLSFNRHLIWYGGTKQKSATLNETRQSKKISQFSYNYWSTKTVFVLIDKPPFLPDLVGLSFHFSQYGISNGIMAQLSLRNSR